MRERQWILVVCLCVLGAQVLAKSTTSKSNYRISEVVRIVSPVSFQCKLADYAPSSAVRFTVRIRDIVQPEQGSESDPKAVLENMLLSGGRIELRNVRFRNYFRLEADLWIDQKDAVPKLLAKGWTQTLSKKQSYEPKNTSDRRHVLLTSNLSRAKHAPAVPSRSVVMVKNVQALLNTKVDCSQLNSETTFEEALDILAHSVNPPLPLLVMWSDLETNAFIEKDMPIGTDGFRTMRLADALDIVLRSVSISSGVKPVSVSKGGFLTIGTAQTLMKRLKGKVYSIEDLLASPSTANEYNNQNSQTGR